MREGDKEGGGKEGRGEGGKEGRREGGKEGRSAMRADAPSHVQEVSGTSERAGLGASGVLGEDSSFKVYGLGSVVRACEKSSLGFSLGSAVRPGRKREKGSYGARRAERERASHPVSSK